MICWIYSTIYIALKSHFYIRINSNLFYIFKQCYNSDSIKLMIYSGIGGMSTGNPGDETRPKNMNVVFIMRIL